MPDWIEGIYRTKKLYVVVATAVGVITFLFGAIVVTADKVTTYAELPNRMERVESEMSDVREDMNSIREDVQGQLCIQLAITEGREPRDCSWLLTPETRNLLNEMRTR